jgi:hypothetical protein
MPSGTNLTAGEAALLNSVLAYPVCLRRKADASAGYNTVQADSTEYYVIPSTFTINGVECDVFVNGLCFFDSSYSCGWYIGGSPTPFLEWQYSPSDGSPGGGYLMSWDNGGNDGNGFAGPEDAYCVLSSSSTVSSPSGWALLYGSGDDGSTVDAAYSTITLSTGACSGIASTQPFRSQNTTWSEIGWSGFYYVAPGSAGSPNFSKASATIAGYTGNRPTVTANRAGVVHITADNVYYDFWWRVYRGATVVIEYGSDSTPDGGGNTGAITDTFSVSAGDVITLGDPGDYNDCTNLQIWWTAT